MLMTSYVGVREDRALSIKRKREREREREKKGGKETNTYYTPQMYAQTISLFFLLLRKANNETI